ncbi:hypothetical protein MLD38_029071 [Melastoma candidum]|uniref:Uncharacterized protein n=1 Tax=Melastoma candidum TaxID=119954 RepID=A0ACB9N2L2_9MYRT|nr:hypothetical protein MLD38_029071 [Melastoma candidum]
MLMQCFEWKRDVVKTKFFHGGGVLAVAGMVFMFKKKEAEERAAADRAAAERPAATNVQMNVIVNRDD